MATEDIDPAYFSGLDPTFLGQQPLLTSVANWVDLLLAPRGTAIVHPAEPIDNTTDAPDDGPYDPYAGSSHQLGTADNRPPDLPMGGVALDDFFRPAVELSGQNFAMFDHAYQVLVGAAMDLAVGLGSPGSSGGKGSSPTGARTPDGGPSGDGGGNPSGEYTQGLQSAMDHVFANWSGDAAEACAAFVGNLVGFIEAATLSARDMARALSTFLAAVVKARESVLGAMADFCTQMHTKEIGDAVAEHKRDVTMISQLIAFGLSGAGVSTELGLGLFLAGQINAIGTSRATDSLSTTGPNYSDIARSYLGNINKIVNDLKAAVDGDLLHSMYEMADSLSKHTPPIVGPTLGDFDKDHNHLVPN